MSNTRYASEDSELAQERYLSSPEYVEKRGISGIAVALKADLMLSERVRSLLFFLQGMSIRTQGGGVIKLAEDIIAAFPERIGTPTMHQVGLAKGKTFDAATTHKISRELLWRRGERDYSYDFDVSEGERWAGVQAVAYCRKILLEELPDLLVQICINPKMRVPDSVRNDVTESHEAVQEANYIKDLRRSSDQVVFTNPEHACFRDIVGALYEFQSRHRVATLGLLAKTSIAKEVWGNLNHALFSGKITILEGPARIGKSTAAEVFCAANPGIARFVSLSGVNSKTVFFREFAKVLGVSSSMGRSSTEMQTRIEDMLQRTRLMVVIDEAQYLWPQGKRIYAMPELINWVNTALFNRKIPVTLIATDQFSERLHVAEEQTNWEADQLRGRIGRFIRLPRKPSSSDVEAVVRHLLPYADQRLVDTIHGNCFGKDTPLPAVARLIQEAKIIAKEDERDRITLEDVAAALKGVILPSDMAMESLKPKVRKGKRKPIVDTTAEVEDQVAIRLLHPAGSAIAKPLQNRRVRDFSPADNVVSRIESVLT